MLAQIVHNVIIVPERMRLCQEDLELSLQSFSLLEAIRLHQQRDRRHSVKAEQTVPPFCQRPQVVVLVCIHRRQKLAGKHQQQRLFEEEPE